MAIAAAAAIAVGGSMYSSGQQRKGAANAARSQLNAEGQKRELYMQRGNEIQQAYQGYIDQGGQSDAQLNNIYGVVSNVAAPGKAQNFDAQAREGMIDNIVNKRQSNDPATAKRILMLGRDSAALQAYPEWVQADFNKQFDEIDTLMAGGQAGRDVQQAEADDKYRAAYGQYQQNQQGAIDQAAQNTPEKRLERMYANYQESPGLAWKRQQGLRGLESDASATGVGGGSRLKAISRFNQGLAMQDFNDYFNRNQQFDAQRMDQLIRNSGRGYDANNQTQANLSNIMTGNATSIQNTGQIQAGQQMADAAARAQIGNTVSQVAGAYAGAQGGPSVAPAPSMSTPQAYAPAQQNRFTNVNARTA